MSITEQVRRALKEMGKATVSQVADYLQVQTFKGEKKVSDILRGLVKSHQAISITHLGHTTFHLSNQPKSRGAVQARLWRFAGHRFQTARPFAAAEAAGMAECDRDYAKRYYRWLCNSGYLAIVSRGRAGALLYQVVAGREHESAPPWNRRAEKRKSKPEGPQAGTPAPLTPPASPSPQPSPTRGEGAEEHRLQTCVTRLDAALEDFCGALVDITGSIGRAWEVIREMKGELLALAVEEQGHGEPTEGDH
jgi:hypothetical protein